MSPRSLLFSSNEERSRQLIQALQELELEVEYCPEIFGAIERLTSRSFDVIVADWDEGPEARFLLKTARELKLNKGAFALAIASEGVKAAALECGADLLLSKPLTPDQVKYALLTCDQFLACLRIWLTRDRAMKARTDRALNQQPPIPQEQTVGAVMTGRSEKPSPALPLELPHHEFRESAAPLHLTFATLDRGFFGHSRRVKAQPESRPSSRAKRVNTGSRFLWTTTILVGFFSLGYAFSQPVQFRKGLVSLQMVYDQATETGGSWLKQYGTTRAASSAADPSQHQAEAAIIPVTSARSLPTAGRVSAPAAGALPTPTSSDPTLSSVATPGARIPQSLRASPATSETMRELGARLGASLLNELEPVSLSENSSAQLLLQKVQPSYPEQALKAGLQGPVVLQAWIRRDGTIRDLKLIHGSLVLGRAAYSAVKQWRYKPYLRNGEAVEAQTYVTIDFRLPQQSLLAPLSR